MQEWQKGVVLGMKNRGDPDAVQPPITCDEICWNKYFAGTDAFSVCQGECVKRNKEALGSGNGGSGLALYFPLGLLLLAVLGVCLYLTFRPSR
jgi:hypothetical protein